MNNYKREQVGKKGQGEIIVIGLFFILLFGALFLIAYSEEKSEERLCTKICERKNMEFIDEFGTSLDCRCLTDEGNIEWISRK